LDFDRNFVDFPILSLLNCPLIQTHNTPFDIKFKYADKIGSLCKPNSNGWKEFEMFLLMSFV